MSARARRTPLLGRVWRTGTGRFALVVLGAVLLAAAVSLVWTPHPLLAADTAAGWQPPSADHWLGTDLIGRDVASWLMAGARTTVVVVVGCVALALALGVPLAVLSALAPARWSEVVVVLVDVLVAFPVLLIAMLLAAPFGGSLGVVVVAVGVGTGVNIARITRPEVVRVTRSDYVLAARASGVGTAGIVRQHVLPGVAPVLLVQASQAGAVAVLAEAGLSYLGYGASSSTPSWGRSLAESQRYLTQSPASVVWPGLVVALTVLALGLLGDRLRDAGDPRLRPRRAVVPATVPAPDLAATPALAPVGTPAPEPAPLRRDDPVEVAGARGA